VKIVYEEEPMKVLDFDLECRPLSWYGGDMVSKEVTAIAARFIGQKKTWVWLLGVDDPVQMLLEFRGLYDQADMVTGHWIRGFDLPTLNGAYFEYGLPLLGPKLTQDTKNDLVQFQGLSKSQENLAAILIGYEKEQMDIARWRSANRLTKKGIAETKRRVIGDVTQHIELRAALLKAGVLRTPKMWKGSKSGGIYQS
jgi:hypothetical protein